MVPGSGGDTEEYVGVSRPIETGRENGAVSVLLGHVVATKTDSALTTDASMDYPRDWNAEHPSPSEVGHQEDGRTIVLHSVAMAPQLQGRGLGESTYAGVYAAYEWCGYRRSVGPDRT